MNEMFESQNYKILLGGYCLGLSYGCYQFLKTIITESSIRNRHKNSKRLTPHELHNYLKGDPSLFKQSYLKNHELSSIPKVIIEGVAHSNHPIKSLFSEKNLIYSELRRVPIYSNNYLFMGVDGLSLNTVGQILSLHDTDFGLYSLSDENKQSPCYIDRNPQLFSSGVLEEIGSRTQKLASLSFLENIMVLLGLFYESVFFWFLPQNVFKGVFIGYSDKEFGIRAGGIMSLMGDLIYNTETKAFTLKNSQPFQTVVKNIESKIFLEKIKFCLFLGLSGITGFWLYRSYARNKGRKERSLIDKEKWNLINIEQVIKADESNLCIICCEKPRSVLPQPCLHLSCCKKCFETLKKKECPICREKLDGYKEIYIEKKLANKNSF